MTNSRGDRLATPRVAVVGCGQWGRNLVRNFHALGALSALCEAVPERANELSKQYGVRALSPDEVLRKPTSTE